MEVKRQLDVLDRNLASRRFLCGDNYTIADMATYPWYGQLVLTGLYDSKEFLDVASYTNVVRWAEEIHDRPAVRRGRKVNRASSSGIAERHDASDLDALETPQKPSGA
jgi:GST-like protein